MVTPLRARLAAALSEGAEVAAEIGEALAVEARNWWRRAFGRGDAWDEGRDLALVMAAFAARDMGHPDVEARIREMIPPGSIYAGSSQIRIRQTFEDTDPDRVFLRMQEELGRAAGSRHPLAKS